MRLIASFLSGALALSAALPCLGAEALDAGATRKLQALGSEAFGIKWRARVVGVSERGVTAVSDGVTTLTARPEFRAYIVHNRQATEGPGAVAFAGSDGALREAGLKFLRVADVDRTEIGDARILQQQVQTGLHDRKRGITKLDAARKGRRTLLVTRKVDDIPVVSSRLSVDLARAGRIALMELSWPAIPARVREEARGLRAALGADFKAPAMEGATIESRDVVILHSPAASFHEDIVAAIRVIYRPERKDVGKKPVRYVDAAGRDVPLPRETDPANEERLTRTAR
jgi:hypothetical protein